MALNQSDYLQYHTASLCLSVSPPVAVAKGKLWRYKKKKKEAALNTPEVKRRKAQRR